MDPSPFLSFDDYEEEKILNLHDSFSLSPRPKHNSVPDFDKEALLNLNQQDKLEV